MNIRTLLVHWPILTLAFSSGGAFAWQEVQRQTIERVVIEQHQQAAKQQSYGDAIIRLQESQKFSDAREKAIERKLDMLIQMQLDKQR